MHDHIPPVLARAWGPRELTSSAVRPDCCRRRSGWASLPVSPVDTWCEPRLGDEVKRVRIRAYAPAMRRSGSAQDDARAPRESKPGFLFVPAGAADPGFSR